MPPSTWPRHCIGFMTLPASAACTLRRIRISPVPGSTATLNHWALKATERGVPPKCPSAVTSTPTARAAAYRSLRVRRPPGCSTASVSYTQEHVGEGAGGAQGGLAGDHGAGGGEGAGVVPYDVRVGLADGDPVYGGGEFTGCDLLVHGRGAVAELGGAHGQIEGAVGQQSGLGVGDMAAGRAGGDHRKGGALADQPAFRSGLPGPGLRLCPAHDADALVEAVARDVQVLLVAAGGDHRLVRADDVARLELQRVQAQAAGQFVEGGLDGEHHLAEAVAAEGARRDVVRVHRVGVDLLVQGAVDRHGLADAVEHHGRAVVAVRARVRDHAQLEGGEGAVAARARLQMDGEGVPGGGAVELLGARVVQFHRAAQPEHRQRDDVLDQHLLFAAEAAADPACHHPDLLQRQVVQRAQGAAREERGLRAGPHGEAAVLVEPGDGSVRLQTGVLPALGAEGVLVDDVGLGEAGLDVADLAVRLAHHIVLGAGDPVDLRVLVVDHGRAGPHGLLGVEDGGQHLVGHLDPAAALFGRPLAVGDYGRDALAHVPDGVVEDAGVVRVLVGVLVACRGEVPFRGVVVGEHGLDAGDAQSGGGVDGDDAGVGVRGAQQLHVQQALDLDVEGVAGGPGHDLGPGRGGQAPADGLAGRRLLHVLHPAYGVLDGPVTGAPAQVALESPRQVRQFVLVEGGRGHQESGRAEAALEALGVEELLLHGMEFALG